MHGRPSTRRGHFHRVLAASALVLAALPITSRAALAQRESPLAIHREAVRAVERDSTNAARARWAGRLRADPRDRAAQLGLATLLDFTYADAAAIQGYRALVAGVAGTPDSYAAFAMSAWARLDEARGALGDAREEFAAARQVAARAGDSVAAGIAALSQAFDRANNVSMAAGMATLDTAGRLLASAHDDALAADLARRRATLLAVQLKPETRAVADSGILLARRAGARRVEADAMRALALYHRMRGFPDSALAALDTTAALQRAARDERALPETMVRIANELLGQRRLGEARTILLAAQPHARVSHNDYALAATENGLGAVAMRVHDLPAARRHVDRALALNRAAGDSTSLYVVETYRVSLLLDTGLPDSARDVQQRVIAHYSRSREIPEVVIGYRTLASIEMAAGNYPAAARALDSADALARANKLATARPPLWFERARLLRRLERDADAAALLRRYLATLAPSDGVARWDAQVYLAEITARHGDAAGAAAQLRAAADALDRWRDAQRDTTLRLLAFQASTHEESDRDAYFARTIAELARRDLMAAAFEQAERRRARTLVERIAEGEALRTTRTGERRGTLGLPTTRATLTSVMAGLPDDHTALLEYVVGAGTAPTTLFVVTRHGARALILPSADSLLPTIRRFLASAESGDDIAPLARSLGAALLQRGTDSLEPGITRLVVVPDGVLHRLPFDALRLADDRIALDRYETAVAPSAEVALLLWKRDRDRPASRGRPRVLAFGDARFSGAPMLDAEDTLPRLPESGREARIAARFGTGSVLRLRDDASESYLKGAPLDSFAVLHIATHAFVDDRTLARSAIALSPGGNENGVVSPGDLAALELGVDLVVLSACRSAGGVVVGGEGVQGLTAPLLAAGARAVVATYWPIDDQETVTLVRDFYDALARGVTTGAALRSAKLAALRRGRPARDWASFTVIGDPMVRVPLAPPPGGMPRSLLIAAGMALFGVGMIALIRRRPRSTPAAAKTTGPRRPPSDR